MVSKRLREQQEDHAIRISKLILWANEQGIKIAKGDGFRDPRVHGEFGEKKAYGHTYSCHKLKLADDLYINDVSHHVKMHDKWDELGGAKRLLHDMNHYSSGYGKYI
jgi:hypothetical protein